MEESQHTENNQLQKHLQNSDLVTITPKAHIIAVRNEGTKVKECNDEGIKQVLRYVFALLGLPADKFNDNALKAVLIDFIRTSYPLMSIEEIRLAFVYALQRRFEVDLRLFDHSFNAEYLSRVITAYREYAKIIMVEPEKLLPPKPYIEPSPEGMHDALVEIIEDKKQFPLYWDWTKVYNYLREKELINDTDEERSKIADQVANLIRMENSNTQDTFKRIRDIESDMSNIHFQARCRKERVKKYFRDKYEFLNPTENEVQS